MIYTITTMVSVDDDAEHLRTTQEIEDEVRSWLEGLGATVHGVIVTVAREIVVTERQQRCRENVERENDLQPQADGSAREPPGCRHLRIDYTGRSGMNAKMV